MVKLAVAAIIIIITIINIIMGLNTHPLVHGQVGGGSQQPAVTQLSLVDVKPAKVVFAMGDFEMCPSKAFVSTGLRLALGKYGYPSLLFI